MARPAAPRHPPPPMNGSLDFRRERTQTQREEPGLEARSNYLAAP